MIFFAEKETDSLTLSVNVRFVDFVTNLPYARIYSLEKRIKSLD